MNDFNSQCLEGVDCKVTNCKYHTTNNCCTANTIKVANENAEDKQETFCSTFKANSSCCG